MNQGQPIRLVRPMARAKARAMRISADQAERQLWLSLWLVAGLSAAILVTATANLLA